jgi:predicted exporter
MTAERYVAWLSRRGKAIAMASGLAVAAAAYLITFHLPLRAAFTYLLPADAPSVRAFDELARRMPARDTMLAIVVAPDAASREAAAEQMIAGTRVLASPTNVGRAAPSEAARRSIDSDLVDHVETDDAAAQAFFRAHRYLYAAVPDLVAVRDALAKRVADAKVRANPLYIALDDDTPDAAIEDLRAKQRAAETKLATSSFVTADGLAQVIVIRTAFNATDVDRDHRLQRRLDDLAAGVHACFPLVQIGFTGGVTNTVAEHHALVHGVLLSTLITCTLVALVLFIHLRDLRMLGLVVANITAATLVGFGIAALTVGHLNAATAFLGAIVAGNGINYGILLVARYSEERRGREPAAAMARAIACTLRPTLVASLGAAIAYGALGATKFRGFADFALIGGVGMVVCWVASFVLLPVLVLRLAPAPRHSISPWFGRIVVRLFGFRRAGIVCAASAAVVIAAGVVSWHYLAHDPYEYDLEELRSQAPDAVVARDWLKFADRTFQRGLAGLAGDTYILLDDERDAAPVVTALRDLGARDAIVGPVASILDAVPVDQPRRLALLADIRRLIDDAAPSLDGTQRDELLALRPPDALAPITARDLPRDLVAKLTERDGRIGSVIAVKPGAHFDETDGRDMIHFAQTVRQVRVRGSR